METKVLISIIVFAALALHGRWAYSRDCDVADADQATLNECASAAFREADRALNSDYQQIVQRLADEPEKKALLVTAQRRWIAYRDDECAFQTSGASMGSVYPMLLSYCKAAQTNERVHQLKAYLACEEGDMSCPVPRP